MVNLPVSSSIVIPLEASSRPVSYTHLYAKEKGVRDQVTIMIGGAPITQKYCDDIGSDIYTCDAASAADAAVKAIS